MKLSNIKIKTQLQLGFAIVLIFVICLGTVAWYQTNAIADQTRMLYNHPLQTRQAIGSLKADILSIRIVMKDLILSHSDTEITESITKMDTLQSDAFDQITILDSQYLGPQEDVDQVKQEFIKYNAIRAESMRLLQEGNIAETTIRTLPSGVASKQVEVVLTALEKVDSFAKNKADELFANSQQLNTTLNIQLLLIASSILILTLIILYFLMHNIRQPLNELTHATQAFKNGDLQAKSMYTLKNEFGVLSDSYNQLAKTIQLDLALKEKVARLSGLMLSINDAVAFFQATLSALLEYSGSQMAAVYLLNSDQKSYEHFISIGLNDSGKASFASDSFEGEFGVALASKKIQHIVNIADDTRFSFYTVSGKFTPNEILTIPVVSDQLITAVISLASIHHYNQEAIRLVNEIWVTMNARVVGILAFKQIQALVKQLENQYRELEAQKNELSAQAIELNQQNSELEAQKKQLSEANRLKTSFISNMSHELRTPLNSVIALSGVLNRRLTKQIPEEEYSYLEVIERNGKQLLLLINDILDLSRIEAGHEEIEISKFEVNDLITGVISTIKPLAQQKNIELLYQPKPGLSDMVSDSVKCQHILQNLVNNAVKFTDAGRVEIELRQKNGLIQIIVSDTGIGISEEHLPYIFDEFRQADSSTSRRFGGTGLGLAIAKKYAQMLGGKITAKSIVGKGSVFTLTLPLSLDHDFTNHKEGGEKPQEIHEMTPTPTSPSTQVKKTILVVEDSEPAIIQLKDILEQHTYHILVARNGNEAFEFIQYTLPDAMILDLMMPGVDGFEVLKTIRETERTAHLPVLILTAKHVTKEELKFLKHNHVYQLIQKGDINRRELLHVVDRMVNPRPNPVKKTKRASQNIEGKPVVLVVEDNPDNLLTIKALLAGDYVVLEAINGITGINQARQHTPHLILMDIALPGMDGIQAFKTIRNDPKTQHIPVIALTASAMTGERESILAYGFDYYISKPIDQMELVHVIAQVLYGKE